MDQKNIQNQNYLDILFSGKNKSYGAYQLRKDFNRRMGISILAGIAVAAIFLAISALANREDTKSNRPVLKEVELGDPPPMNENEPPPPPPPPVEPPPPVKAQVKFTPPVIKKDNEIEKTEVPEQKELEEAAISNQDVEGIKNNEAIVKDVEFKKPTIEEKKVEAPKPVDNKIYEIVEQEPSYPGGEDKITADVSKNFVYPQLAIENGIEGTVIVRFVVEKNGSVSNVQLVRGLGYGIDEAAIKAVKKLKKFSPAKQNGQAVRYYYSIPVICQLQ